MNGKELVATKMMEIEQLYAKVEKEIRAYLKFSKTDAYMECLAVNMKLMGLAIIVARLGDDDKDNTKFYEKTIGDLIHVQDSLADLVSELDKS